MPSSHVYSRLLTVLALVWIASLQLNAQDFKLEDLVQAKILTSHDRFKPGAELRGVVVLDIKNGFHINSDSPDDPGLIPTKVEILGVTGLAVSRTIYPTALVRTFQFSEKALEVYEGKTVIGFVAKLPASIKPGKLELSARIRFQACNDDTCFRPVTKTVKATLDVGPVPGKITNKEALSSVRWK
ncbi:MAG: protein-disulfide reductase DsbD domain-containing protein [Acidobacteriota bacterium]